MEETNIIKDTLKEELQRNLRSQLVYFREIEALPRGSLSVRLRRGRNYCYLKYRAGDKVVTDYVGPEERVGEKLKESIERRKALQESLKRLKREQAFIEKALGRKRNAQ